MTLRTRASLLLVLFSLPLALLLTACNKVEALAIVPGPGIDVLTAAGQTAQYTAFAQEEMGSGPITTANVTNSVTWSTSNPNIATINSSGLATAVGAGYVEITAVASDGAVAASDLTVMSPATTTQATPSITILPGSAEETFIGETTQFTATGNLTGIGASQNLTTQVTWLSSNAQVATINSSGLATATGAGTTMIIAQSGGISSSATVTVTISGTGTPSLTVTPNVAADTFAGETTQFIASGSLTGVGSPQNLTGQVTWVSSNAQVATINSAGLATAVGAGTTTITAVSGGLNATAILTVTVPASGTGSGTPTLTVVPSSVAETFSGETTQFTATGNLTGIGAIQNLTNQVTWVSSNVQVATINAAGLATAVGSGTTTIIAESGGLIASATLGVSISASGAPSLSVIPNTVAETFAGETTQLTASGNLTGIGGPQNLTNQVTWLSSNVQVATVSASGLVTTVAAGTTTIIAESGGLNASSTVTVTLPASGTGSGTPTLTVTPSSASETFAGETTQFIATGNLTGVGASQDLTSQVTWFSSNAQVATINAAGLATATGAGTTTIIAQSGGISSSATVTVTISVTGTASPSLTVTPNVAADTFAGETTQFIASGNLTGVGSPQNLTGQVTWVSSNAQVATINSAGLATSVGSGTTTITAVSGGLNATATLTVTVPASGTGSGTPTLTVVPSSVAETFAGETTQFTATGNLTGVGAIQNLTNQVTWVSSNVQVATINAAGLATAVGSGTTTIIAESGGLTANATLGVSIAASGAPSISVIPNTVSETFAGETTQLTASGNLTGVGGPQNLTNQVTWLSSNVQVATVGATTGLVTTLAAGTTTIIAESGGLNASSTVTVTLPASGTGSGTPTLIVTPSSASETFAGETTQFLATGNLTGVGTSQNLTSQVTWFSSNAQVATINAAGLATAVGAGTTTIVALAPTGGLNASASLSVTISGAGSGSSIASISVIPGSQAVSSPGNTSQFIAIGTTGAGATVNLTNQVAWNSSSAQIATIGGATGLATAVGQGIATISALYANSSGGTVVAGTATFTVAGGTTEQYTAVIILPGSQNLSASGQTGQFIALATLGSTGLETDVTSSSQITWSSSIPTIATVSASGLAEGVAAGSTTIMAKLANPDGSVVSGTATVVITSTPAPEPLLSLAIVPSTIAVGNLQDTGQFLAIGTYSSAPYTRDLTNLPSLTWISDVPSVFPVSTNSGGNSGATAGIVTAYGIGVANIIAEATSTDGSIQTATATFSCPYTAPQPGSPGSGTCYPGSQAFALLSTLTIYNEGLNTSNWELTAPSATGTPNVIHCGPGWAANGGSGGSVCTATYPMGTTVILTAPAQTGVAFGGWSYNCTPSDVNGNPLPGPTFWTAAGPNYCTVSFSIAAQNSNVAVGGIFN
jgi:uncharacterized protein YjdB